MSSNSSRFGLRGGESLGGGLDALWQIESAINVDAGGGTLASRETFIGLQGEWGTLKLGNFLSPYDDMHPIFGSVPTLTSSILTTSALWAQGGLSKSAGGFDSRLANSVRYDTPDWGGFEGGVQVALGEDDRDSYVFSVGGSYIHGAFEGGVAYERNHRVRGPELDDSALTVAAGWNFGVGRLAGVYERLRYGTPVGPLTRDFYGMSGTVPVASGTVYGFVGRAADGKARADVRVAGLTTGGESGAWQYEVSYTYPLSQRTLAYAGYVRIDNESRAAYNFGINPYAADAPTGLKLNGFVLGAVHFF